MEPSFEFAPARNNPDVLRRQEEIRAAGDRIAELAAHIHAATYRLLVLLREFDADYKWVGFKSCAQFLSWRTGIGLEAAREKVRVANALPGLPKIAAGFEKGALSYSKVRAITRIADSRNEEFLLQIATHGTAAQVERVVRSYRKVERDRERRQANENHERRHLVMRHDEHGNLVIEGRLPAELGARFLKALNAAVDAVTDPPAEAETAVDGAAFPRKRGGGFDDSPVAQPRASFAQRRADALVLLADSALAAGLPGRRAADTHEVVVHVDAAVLVDPAAEGRSELEDGVRVSAETSRRLACDAGVVAIVEDGEGNALSVGRKRRTVPPAMRRALAARDKGCRFPGCTHARFLEAHHVRHWADGGETSMENLVHLCSFHHRELHEGGLRIERDPNGELVFKNRWDLLLENAPAPPQPGSVDRLLRENDNLGIDARTIPLWGGDPIDYGITIAALFWERRDLESGSDRPQ
ncbi:MAG: DUF222 domain-containing protein [bacterium]